MVNEKKYLAQHPLKIWKSEVVTKLLTDFLSANFTKAGIDKNLAEKFITTTWKGKNSIDFEILRKEGDALMMQAKGVVVNQPDESDPLDIINLDGVDSFLDIGANKLATINYYAQRYKQIRQFIGVDVIPQRGVFIEPGKSVYHRVDPEAKSFPVKNESIDVVNVQFVFHHFPDLASIKRSLGICRSIIKPDGRLILWEEAFSKSFDPSLSETNINEIGIKTDRELSRRFYNLDEGKRWEFIVANDWLINVNNPHMPWTGQYYNWREWTELLSEFGFVLEKQYNLGLRVNGRLKQGVHMVGVFRKT